MGKNWVDDLLLHKRLVVQAPRRGHKTDSAIKWGYEQDGSVLYVTPSLEAASVVASIIEEKYKDEIVSFTRYPHRIKLRNGKVFYVECTKYIERIRGLRTAAVILDEVGYMTEDDVITAMSCAAHNIGFSFLALYTKQTKNGLERIKKMKRAAPIDYIYIDYMDMIESGMWSAEDVRMVQEHMTFEQFKAEMGPFQVEMKKRPRNYMFKHLLSRKKAI